MKVARSSDKTLACTYLLSRTRALTQACDVIMMEKFMLVGSAAQEWRKQICPSLTSKRIHRLVSHFTPNASAPEAVEPEVLKHLLLEVILCVCVSVCVCVCVCVCDAVFPVFVTANDPAPDFVKNGVLNYLLREIMVCVRTMMFPFPFGMLLLLKSLQTRIWTIFLREIILCVCADVWKCVWVCFYEGITHVRTQRGRHI